MNEHGAGHQHVMSHSGHGMDGMSMSMTVSIFLLSIHIFCYLRNIHIYAYMMVVYV